MDFDDTNLFKGVYDLIIKERAKRVGVFKQLPEANKEATLVMERAMRREEDDFIFSVGLEPLLDDELTALIKGLS